MEENLSDEEIISIYKNENEEIFKVLIDRYTSSVFNFSARLSGKDNAPDITQEIFIKVWKNIKKYNQKKSSFKTWLFTIAKNTNYDFLRKKKITNFSQLEEKTGILYEDIPDEKPLPYEILQKLEDKVVLENIIEKLNYEQKTVLSLHYQEEMTFNEIGKILNKPINTVKSYHHRALEKIKDNFNK